MKKDCWNCKNDYRYEKFPCDYCNSENINDFWKPKDEMKDFAIEELEKIKEEIKKIRKSGYFISSDGQSGGYYERKATDYESDVFEIIDNHISELKGEKK